ncbi:hypothetical protein [Leeuwenhoekiella marinoflava]|uniref:hypothetical protein n=1 Tax=Leeuwenhoekiella marinoflava TaxID=988 RepID=UPI00300203D7
MKTKSYIKSFYTLLQLLAAFSISAQVGINTSKPTAMLDVIGDAKIDSKLFLENPGNSDQIRGSKLIIERTDKSIVQYDIDVSKYGPINYAELVFRQTSIQGLDDYDTKINIADYTVTVQGFYFREYATNNTSVNAVSNSGNNVVEGFQVYAYKNTDTNTWFIRCLPNNGYFRTTNGTNTSIDIYMNLIVYRKRFIAKEVNYYDVDLGRNETATLPKPPGF